MKYQYYTASDFALDEKFQQWVLKPNHDNEQFWNDWIHQHPQQYNEIAEAIEMVRLAGLSTDQDANTAFLKVWQELQDNVQQTEKTRQMQVAFRYTRIAAMWIGFLLVATYVCWSVFLTDKWIEYRTSYGQIKEIVLPDGSTVTLNANSYIRVANNHWPQEAAREVEIEGEAFFEIVKTKDYKRFIVKTPDNVAVQVLGTEFNVNTRRKQTSVYLQSGKVAFQSPTQQVTLKPGELAAYDTQAKKINKLPVREENQLAWKSHLFVFDDTPLQVIAQELEDNFGLKVIISSDALAQQRFTAKVSRQRVDVLLKVLSETLQVDMVQENKTIVMQPKITPVP